MSLLILNRDRKYKPNIAIDMVRDCIRHYKQWRRPIETITLNPALFHKWKEGIEERNRDLEDDKRLDVEGKDRVEFKDATIVKGSKFMNDGLVVKLKELVLQ